MSNDHPGPITPLPQSELPADLAEFLRPRVERLGYLGAFFTHTAHHPAALLAFLRFTEEAKEPLEARLVEVIALTVATLTGNDYERNQHERLCIALGLAQDWIARVESLRPGDAAMTPEESAVQELAIAIIERFGRETTPQLSAVVGLIGEEPAIAALFLIGRYMTHAMVVNSLGLTPPVEAVLNREGVDAPRV